MLPCDSMFSRFADPLPMERRNNKCRVFRARAWRVFRRRKIAGQAGAFSLINRIAAFS